MLQIQQICKEYKTGTLVQKALDGVSLNLRDNEFVAILGPSGSGKTTLLNIIGGLDRYNSGDLIINGISTKKYKDRDWDSYRNHTIGFVFQSYNLIPHQTVLANVELALTISGISKSERRERATKALEQVGLGAQLHKKPNQMSGGQMQRVAIARALVNDPDILLADEPTGALDSETSIQVMELLKEVAKERLVVMVTHNPELAEEYATRIVNLRDGKIRSDSDPYEVADGLQEEPEYKNMGKSSMSFLTALSLSFNNLKTKKARTLLTSFAGSIGIIGIALILSLSTGVNAYIQSVEEETLSEYPLQIQSTGFDFSSMMGVDAAPQEKKKTKKENEVNVVQMVTNTFSTMDANDLGSLKTYLDSGKSGVEKYTNAIEYSYDVAPQIYKENGDKVRQVHPDRTFQSIGLGAGSGSNSIMSSMMSTNVFFKMPENTSLYENQYDVKAGRWPKKYNECIVVLTSGGSISDFVLYTLGLRDPLELDEMVKQFANEETATIPENLGTYTYEDIVGTKFKLVNSSDYYQYDSEYKVWKDKSEDDKYLKDLVKKGEELTVVGIVQQSEDANGISLSPGISYPASLTKHVAEQAQKSEIVQKQLSQRDINIFTNKKFGEENEENPFNPDSLFSVDQEAMAKAFQFDEAALTNGLSGLGNLDLGSLNMNGMDLSGMIDLSGIQLNIPDLPPFTMEDFMKEITITATPEEMNQLMSDILTGYKEYTEKTGEPEPDKVVEHFAGYLATPEVQKMLTERISTMVDTGNLEQMISTELENYTKELVTSNTSVIAGVLENQVTAAMGQIMGQVSTAIQNSMQAAMAQVGANMKNAFHIDVNAFAKAITMKMSAEELGELMMSLGSRQSASYENNLKELGYVDFAEPAGIDIYPKDFESKGEVVNILDNYNDEMEKAGKDEQVITYTDMVGTLMSSVTDIVDVISYVLIAFVAISLIVSSIMIGVITYISVLERKKEIGILRAMGASKGNISQVFNAETIIIGLCAGLIGIGLSLLILIPGNMLIHYLAGNNDISAALPVLPAIILIALSVILTLIGGLIPSKKAAKSDPVTALRTE